MMVSAPAVGDHSPTPDSLAMCSPRLTLWHESTEECPPSARWRFRLSRVDRVAQVVRLRMFHTDAGRTAGTRPLPCRGVALGYRTAKAHARGLSTLHSMAFGLTVYASQCGLPRSHAKLASDRWSGATGRAFHPQGSAERFLKSFLLLIHLSQGCLAQSITPKRAGGRANLPLRSLAGQAQDLLRGRASQGVAQGDVGS
jgi:hypothetical protein